MNVSMNVGQKVANTVEYFDANGNDTTQTDGPPTWSTSDPAIIAVDTSGNVTAVAPGSATYTIAATAGGNAILGSPITVTVNAISPPPPGPAVTFVIWPGTPA